MIWDRLPNTAILQCGLALGSIGIPLGMLAARRPRGIMDRIVNVLSFAIISVPEFWLALMLILVVFGPTGPVTNFRVQWFGARRMGSS